MHEEIVIRKYRHLSGKNKISKFPQVGKMSTDSNINLSHVCTLTAIYKRPVQLLDDYGKV